MFKFDFKVDEIEEDTTALKEKVGQVTKISSGYTPKPWWNSGLSVLYRLQVDTRKKASKYPTPQNLDEALAAIREWKKAVRKAKSDYFGQRQDELNSQSNTSDASRTISDTTIDWYDSEEILPANELSENIDLFKLNSLKKDFKDISLVYMVAGFVLDDIRDNEQKDLSIKKSEEQHTDLIPGVYEGGAKIWECTDDLLEYLSENYPTDKWSKQQVLDLGCGSGLLGIYAFCCGAQVTFQDYNKDVLEKITIPNVLLNTKEESEEGCAEGSDEIYDYDKLKDNARFFSGDWSKWSNLTKKDGQFDIILTSETIYNSQNQLKLLDCVYEKLKPDGVLLLAAKTYYFGVGGSLRCFEGLMDKDERFSYKVVWTSSEGVKREILEIKKK